MTQLSRRRLFGLGARDQGAKQAPEPRFSLADFYAARSGSRPAAPGHVRVTTSVRVPTTSVGVPELAAEERNDADR